MSVRAVIRLFYVDGTGSETLEKAFIVPSEPKNTGAFEDMLTEAQRKELAEWVAPYAHHPTMEWELQRCESGT